MLQIPLVQLLHFIGEENELLGVLFTLNLLTLSSLIHGGSSVDPHPGPSALQVPCLPASGCALTPIIEQTAGKDLLPLIAAVQG